MLSIQEVSASYGAADVLRGVSLSVQAGEIVTLIGSNGAGKTTLLMTVCGNPRAINGRILFEGRDITRCSTDEIMRMGIAHVPEGRHVFPRMTVLENLQLGGYFQSARHNAQDLEKSFTLFPRLKERIKQTAGTLSGGEQQMLALARALMARPKLLLLDEPSLGLAPLIVRDIFTALKQLNERESLTIFLVEQNAHAALKLAHHGHVLVGGQISLSGSGQELISHPAVRAAYLEGHIERKTA